MGTRHECDRAIRTVTADVKCCELNAGFEQSGFSLALGEWPAASSLGSGSVGNTGVAFAGRPPRDGETGGRLAARPTQSGSCEIAHTLFRSVSAGLDSMH